MPTDISRLTSALQPDNTVLLFGAGSSIPSGAPSVRELQVHFEHMFDVSADEYSLAEQTSIIENQTRDRARSIGALREKFTRLRPTGALLNLPLYDWKSIFTTNYDELIEDSYKRRSRSHQVYASNFDFKPKTDPLAVPIFKLHGTINDDVSDGTNSRIILTQTDYDLTEKYREDLFDRFRSDIGPSDLVVIGHSLADTDIKDIVDRALNAKRSSGSRGKITLFMYKTDDGRASIYENRGIEVCFGGLDDFFAGLAKRVAAATPPPATADPLDQQPALRPATVDVQHALRNTRSIVSSMFNGWPASYADIQAGHTFQRTLAENIVNQFTEEQPKQIAVVLGPSGVGKTTAARQVLTELNRRGHLCWEHKVDQLLLGANWRSVGKFLTSENTDGCLLIDDAHTDLSEINDLIDGLITDKSTHLRIILTSSKNHWRPRVKTPSLYKNSVEYLINKVSTPEINRLLDLVDSDNAVRVLVGDRFAGFSRPERRRRLAERCEADMFVCLKNIFATEKLDDIILREYADLDENSQEVYRTVAAMEHGGVRVHRQLVVRLLGISPMAISGILQNLDDIIHEQTVDQREGIYAWHGRHLVITQIIADHKFHEEEKRYALFDRVIDNIQPTYDIELRTMKELCNFETGIPTLSDRKAQNVLLRKMLSVAPRERVPRHRLIHNLIALQRYDEADAEIRIFEKDFKLDGPAARYKIESATHRALYSPGLLEEDRVVLLDKAKAMATGLLNRHRFHKGVIASFCELGIAIAKFDGDTEPFEHGIALLRAAEDQTSDPDISQLVARLERKMDRVRKSPDLSAFQESEPLVLE
jgi:hypothetical protein